MNNNISISFIKDQLLFLKEKKNTIINDINRRITLLEKKPFTKDIIYSIKYLKKLQDNLKKIEFLISELDELLELSSQHENDISYIDELYKEYQNIKKIFQEIKKKLLFICPFDKNNAFIEIKPGSGGIESQNWAFMLFNMYIKWAEKKKFKIIIINITFNSLFLKGIKNAIIKIIGKFAFGLLKTESGIHRLVRKSPFDSKKRRHTSFSSVCIYPEISEKSFSIKPSELKIDTYKSSGAGGQHVNTTDSAVRIKHIPTGYIVQCQSERSQHKNKLQAMKMLESKIFDIFRQNNKKSVEKIKNKKNITWGNHIRSYILDESKIKDKRVNIIIKNTKNFLNGNIDILIEENLKKINI